MSALGGKKKYSDNLGSNQAIAKSNRQILEMGKKGYYLPGYNKDNYNDLVIRNTETLISNQSSEIERRKQEADVAEKNKDKSILGNVYEELSSGHFFKDVALFFKKTVDVAGDTISAISNSPKYLMYAAGIILLIILLKK